VTVILIDLAHNKHVIFLVLSTSPCMCSCQCIFEFPQLELCAPLGLASNATMTHLLSFGFDIVKGSSSELNENQVTLQLPPLY
jgi:hypothetical protein